MNQLTQIAPMGIVLVTILLGILFNNVRLDKMESRIEARFTTMEARFAMMESRFTVFEGRLDRMQADLSQFYMILGKHEGRIESIEKK